jgi:LPXTG-site transpeptidase (sortase) family protein
MKRFAPKNISRLKAWHLLLVGALVLGLVAWLIAKNQTSVQDGEPLITYSTDSPDESKEAAQNYQWRGASDEPKRIIIDKIGVDAMVQKAGVDQHKKVAVPNNVHLAGWFSDSVKPGQNGLSVIAGHVTGRTSDGVFKQLELLHAGDTFSVELGSGDIKRYVVTNKLKLPEPETASQLFSQDPKIKSQLNLITCGGEFDQASEQYADRIIISGELQN